MPSTFLTCKEQERLACFPDDIQQWDLITYFTLTEHDCSRNHDIVPGLNEAAR